MTIWRTHSDPTPTGEAPVVPSGVVDRKSLAEWLTETCLAFGSQVSTAYKVAGTVVEQIEKDEKEQKP